jgi:hypothetical protein
VTGVRRIKDTAPFVCSDEIFSLLLRFIMSIKYTNYNNNYTNYLKLRRIY